MPLSPSVAAAGLALAASAVLSFIDNFVLAVSQEAGLWQFQVVRALFALPVLVAFSRLSGKSLRPRNPRALLARSLPVSLGLLIYFAALGTLPVAQAGAGLFSAPIWVLLLSALLFRVRITILQLAAILAGFAGVLILLRPDPASLSVLPLAAGLFYGLGTMFATRRPEMAQYDRLGSAYCCNPTSIASWQFAQSAKN